jgi:hypothetical protein
MQISTLDKLAAFGNIDGFKFKALLIFFAEMHCVSFRVFNDTVSAARASNETRKNYRNCEYV